MKGYRPKIENSVSDKMKNLIMKCLSVNPCDRPSFDEIYDLLSNDFSYLNEDVDKDCINDYIEKLNSFGECNESIQKAIEPSSFEKMKMQKKQNEERENYSNMINALSEKVENLQEVEVNCIHIINFFYGTVLHSACETGNLELVKDLISLNKIDIQSKNEIFYYLHEISF